MKTTIDLSDALFRQVKATAAVQGITLKTLITRALERELGINSQASHIVYSEKQSFSDFASVDHSAQRVTETVETTGSTESDSRTDMASKFLSGEWSVDLPDWEETRRIDRKKALTLAQLWRD